MATSGVHPLPRYVVDRLSPSSSFTANCGVTHVSVPCMCSVRFGSGIVGLAAWTLLVHSVISVH